MDELDRFRFTLGSAGVKVSWDEWLHLEEIERARDRTAFLAWIERNPAAMVNSTYPCKSVLLDIAVILLKACANG